MIYGIAFRLVAVAVGAMVAGVYYLYRKATRAAESKGTGQTDSYAQKDTQLEKVFQKVTPTRPSISKQLAELWQIRHDIKIYQNKLGKLHQHRKDFLAYVDSKDSKDWDLSNAKETLQILVDYHQRYPVENLSAAAQPLIGAGICFTLAEFDFPQEDSIHTAHLPRQGQREQDYISLIRTSLPHCQSELEIREAMKDVLHLGGSSKGRATLEEIATHHWSDSSEFAQVFLDVERTFEYNPNLQERIRQAILNRIPVGAIPPADPYRDRNHLALITAIQRVLRSLSSSSENNACLRFIESLVQARPLYADFFYEAGLLYL